ncbi:GNAT family N-acetyltransferase [Vannielia sp.]|uniref:GNAT family N-acetyltransferase n=1 Tax=Vannielia sp. TaxID=2813045 RepID=UPI002606AB17|nr:GNAT family N-acetyltransferase [Vannielia sp.]MDF1872722.1 GNAT family N-acetyltransferase [Vannielia sp.]
MSAAAADLARLHARCFTSPRPWTAEEIASLLTGSTVFLIGDGEGFAMGQAVAGEAELLTIAIPPEARRQGRGAALLEAFHREAFARGATQAILEVSAENADARALYAAAGYTQTGCRPGYYRALDGSRLDALVLARSLPALRCAAAKSG